MSDAVWIGVSVYVRFALYHCSHCHLWQEISQQTSILALEGTGAEERPDCQVFGKLHHLKIAAAACSA